MIRTCFFDMGNVLVFFSHQRMCEQVAALYSVEPADVVAALMESGLQNKLETGTITDDAFCAQFNQQLGRAVAVEDLKRAAADIFWPNDDIVPVLHELKDLGLRLVLLSNTSNAHYEFIRDNFCVLQPFDDLTMSFACQSMKPHEGIYQDALSRAQCDADECFFTDDLPANIDRAREFGIHAEQFLDVPKLKRDLRSLGVNVR